MRGILYYDTKYGTTEKISRWISAEVSVGKVEMRNIYDGVMDMDCDFYILGCPIYIGKPRAGMYQFIAENKVHMKHAPIFLFIVSWAQSTQYHQECNRFLDLMEFYLKPAEPVLSISLPGSLVLDNLTGRDYNALTRLLGRIDKLSDEFQSKEIEFVDNTDEKESREFGKAINNWLQHSYHMF